MRIILHRLAQAELVDGASFYATKAGPSMGESFIAEFERTVDLLSSHPRLGSRWTGGLRRLPLRRFPYSIIYADSESEVRIVALAHQSRRPGYWR
ncbi:MAG: type II toxin-antitoxin system RelE/ParE family toxin, partial [Rhodoferax sp.]|nr:type II toxin-antitoxin system RelE/ParE family toxin [Rhodoferax sp.]